MESNTSMFSSEWFKDAVQKGVILGVVHIFIMLVLYYVIPNKLASFTYLFFILILNFAYVIYSGIQQRKALGGYIEYGKAFQYATILLVVNGIVGTVFYILFLLIEPSLPSVLAQAQLDVSIYWAQKFGAPQASIDEIRDKFDMEATEKQAGFGGLAGRFGIGLIFYVLGGLIAALFIRKRAPETF